ncbi:MAG: cytochrome c biogenesis protein [Opitutales bacterium]
MKINVEQWLPRALLLGPALLLAIAFFAALLGSPDKAYDTATLGKLPVLSNGRIQPLDSLARNSLLILSGKSSVKVEGGRLSAIEWLTELIAQPELAKDRKVFLLDNREIKGQLHLDEDTRRFSYRELTEHRDVAGGEHFHPLDTINEQAQLANEVEAKARNAYQRAILQLFNQLWLYRGITNSLRPEDTTNFPEELTNFEQALAVGVPEFRKQQQGEAFDREAIEQLSEFVQRYNRLQELAYFFPVPPAAGAPVEDWMKTGDALIMGVREGEVPTIVTTYAEALNGFRYSRPSEFNTAVEKLHTGLQEIRPGDSEKAAIEYRFNKAAPFTWAQVGYVGALLLSCLALVNWSPGQDRDSKGSDSGAEASSAEGEQRRIGRPLASAVACLVRIAKQDLLCRSALLLTVAAFVLHTGGILTRMSIEGRPPVTNLYSSAIFIGWGTVLFALILELYSKRALALITACLVGFATLLIAHYLSLQGDTLEMMQAVLDSNFWLGTHVVVITLGYSAMFVAGCLGIIWLIMRLVAQKENTPQLRRFSGIIYGVICFSLIFSFTGTVLGGIWADQSWGRFWGWDPKENGAMLIVIWTAIAIHAKMAGLIRQRGLAAMAVGGNIVTAWSWFGTNMLGIGLHSYGFTDAASITLYAFVISQVLILSLALLPVAKGRREVTAATESPVA